MPGGPVDRRRIGGDVFLTRYPPGSKTPLRLDVGFEPPDWKARVEGRFHQPTFPGTAVEVDGKWHEIVRVSPSAGPPRRSYYDLEPFDEAESIRVAFELTPEACEALTRRHREQESRRRRGIAVALLPVVTGLLPGADQTRLENAYGVSARRGTMISAAVLLLASVAVLSMTGALALGLRFGELHALIRKIAFFSPLALYLAIESYVRLRMAGRGGPAGSLLLVLPLFVFRGLRETATAGRPVAERPADLRGILGARDVVRPFEGRDDRLLVLSQLPKEHWTANVTGIEVEGETYVLVDRKVIDTPEGRRHQFILEKPAHEVLYRAYVRFHPEEVREVYKAQRRVRSAMWVETFAALWGLLDGATQERLAKLYRYDPPKFTRRTIFWSAVAGGMLLLQSVWLLVKGLGSGWDALGVFFAIFLLWESWVRWGKVRQGVVPGSLLGLLLRPMARRFLRWE